ncbi:hypothetical protein Pan189_08650 [Stratiformator vulcanicus]|uniref:Uncharacterized protein n=2 Tax=Stratiformator vulcanicus TaxID=2527980 RepID=A0A517QY28_9PLAN|nr:hypothetical protein Pan189_08650 [Stratiformator vulcanicus]
MITQSVFDEVIDNHASSMGGDVSVEIQLVDGSVLNLKRVVSTEADYFVAEIYPVEGMSEEALKSRERPLVTDDPTSVVFDRIIVAYESIRWVRISVKRTDLSTTLGFNSSR